MAVAAGRTRACPACNSSRAKSLGEKGGFELVVCRVCSTLYAPIQTDTSQNYDDYYTVENLQVPDFIATRLDEIVDSFAAYRNNNRLLDIGCGAGSLLMAAKRANWNAEGVDVSASAIEDLHRRGLKAFQGDLIEASYPTAYFDVVTAGELIEHVPDPASLVAEIARILRPGGILWATTPHSKGASARLLKLKWSVIAPPEHLHLFSIRGLKKLLARHGFRRVRVATEGLNPTELLGALRSQETTPAGASEIEGHTRVDSSYSWNEAMLRNARRRMLKNAANAVLRASRLGDSLKVWAEL